ncbi:uncharacterized protein [Branchiostoma lanceolatum]|uniref:uncharacterized protein n=1 Tax=Branchiostoma lanceolatum TaxID=7740 RepID=UPI00345531A7
MELILLVALALLVVYLYVENVRLRRKYPPGPRAWPIVGNLRDLARGQHRVFAEWRLKYGDIFTVWIGPRPAVVLNGQNAVKEALQKHGDIFSSRPELFMWERTLPTRGKGIAPAPYGPEWKETRKVALTWLNTFGAGKQSLEPTIVQEAQDLVQVFKDKRGQPFDPEVTLNLAMSNVICSVVFGRRFNHDDERFSRLVELNSRHFRLGAAAQALNVYPILRHVSSFRRKLEELVACIEEIRGFIIEVIQEHRETFDPSYIRDVIDGFLLEEHQGNRILTDLPQDNIIHAVGNLFAAGTDTTANSIRWALLYLVRNPDVQRKVQDEIDTSLGKQTPSMLLREHLPYTEATIRETQRIRTIVASSLPHETTAPATVLGHQIPAGTFIVPNLWSLHMDPKYWPDPERFDPTRFLDADGQLAQRTESFLPFSTGPRKCLGEQLAKYELFLFFTSLLQQFTFKLPDGAPPPDTEGIFGLVLSPRPFEICAIPRGYSSKMELLLLVVLALLAVYLYVQNVRFRRKYPPGPHAWPIVGNLRDLARGPHRVFAEWRLKYGDIFTVWLGPRPAVVLNGQDAVKEALQKHGDIFSSRPDLFLWGRTVPTRGKGIATAPYGPEWKETRKVALTWLNTFGAGKQSLEPTIVQEAQDLVQVFKDERGQPLDPTVPLGLAVSNVICSVVFGRRFNHDDERFSHLMELMSRYFRSSASAQVLNVYPILRYIPSVRRKMEEVMTCSEEIRSFVIEIIQEHRETFDPNNIRDVIDGFLLEEHQGNRILSELPLDNIINVIKNLFAAGTDTTATTLRWALLYLLKNPDVQRKVQDEIDVSLGKQTPSMLLRGHLPYTESTIREAQRIRTIVPSSLPHETTGPATILGQQIPSGTFIVPNLWSLHMDPKYWPDPERFDPTRFLDADGQLAPRTESFLPFSTGPRKCLGEQLAKYELFLFFTSLLQQFTFKMPEGAPLPDTEGIFGLVFTPKPFEISAISRV